MFDNGFSAYGYPVLYTLFVWWFSTGLIVYLDSLPRRTFRWSMAGATVLAIASLYGLQASASDTSATGAFTAFTCALLVWGWHEASFLMGIVTGPRRTACPPGCRGLKRLGYAIQALAWHELAIAATAALVVALTQDGPNQVGTWTFLLLWGMRLSAKLNVFLGVPNLTEEFLPEHLDYLKSYFTRRPMNVLFPLSVTASTILTILLAQAALDPSATAANAAAFTILATLAALALLEHWMLVLPLPASALWSWYLPSPKPPQVLPQALPADRRR